MKIGTHHSPKNDWGRRTSAEHTTVFRNLLFLLLLLLLSASGLLAQNFPPASNCSSKDLDMVEMLLQADQMGMDYQSGRRRMKVTVTNRTGTDRKAFVVWGTLNRYDSYGKFKSQEPLFVCVDNVQRNSTVTLSGKDSLYYNDDETIVVTNIYTAWSSASVNENCETISADPSKIAPRCAVKQSLKVYTGVNARFKHLQGNCDNNGVGRVHARPFGGLGPYKVGIKNEKDESVAVGQEMINEADSAAYDLPPGIYKLTMMDGKNNSSVFTRVVDGPPPFASPEVSVNHPDCQLPKGLIKVMNRDKVAKYRLIQNGITLPNALQEDEFADVESGDYELIAERGVCRGQKKFTVLPRPFIPQLPDVAVTHPDCIAERGKLKVRNPQASVKYFLRQNEIVLDSAAVDEFTAVASGEYLVEAKGLRCGLRNKVVVNPKPPRPDKPKLEKENPTCATPKGLIRLTNRDINATYQLIKNGIIAPFNDNQDSVEAGDYSMVATRGACNNAEVVTVEARPFVPELPDVAVTHPDCIAERGKLKVRNPQASVKYFLRQNEMVLDSAAVDEFTAVASGEYQVEAKGLRCGLRNKVVVNPKPPRPDKPKVDKLNPSCTAPKGLVRLLNRDNNATYQLIKNGLILPFNSDEASVDSGNYSLVATRGICTNDEWVYIAARPFIPGVAKTQVAQPSCTVATGAISLSETQSNVIYSLSQNDEVKYTTDNTNFIGVVAGSYQLVARHLQGQQCTTISPNPLVVDPQPLVPNAPVLSVAHPTCTNRNGYVTVSNKQSLVTYIIVQGSDPVATANGDGVFADIAPGDYKVVAQAPVCKGETVTTIHAQPKTPTQPQLEITAPSFCNPLGAVKVVNPTDAGLQYSKDNGKTWQSTSTFAGLTAGSGSSLSFVVSLTTGGQTCTSPAATVTCAAPAGLTDEVGGTSAGTGLTSTSTEVGSEESASEKKEARYLGIGKLTEATVTIKPVPNPFQTTVRFLINSPEAGRAVLDIFNGQGQLIKTVYQGYVYEGASYYDLILPRTQKNADLVYVFRIGNKVVTGKLIQLGNKF